MQILVCLIAPLFIGMVACNSGKTLYDLGFANLNNFKVLTIGGGQLPNPFIICDTTEIWSDNTFYFFDPNVTLEDCLKNQAQGEFHPGCHNYIFYDQKLDTLVKAAEKWRLREQSIKLVPRKIKLYGSNYLSKSSNQDFGYTFYVSDPVYTSCKRYAFLQITAYHKYLFLGKVDRSIYSQHTLMFKKTGRSRWEQIGANSHWYN
ncbi:MAG: hypothetical protein IPH36_13705 [Saprospiraceae bacterium]|nr:hypothetical protein [Saprospiraceae bacterium]